MILDKIFKNSKGEYVNLFDVLFGKGNTENYIYTLAEAHAIDLIARTIAKCEIQTFELKNGNIEENKGDLYWTLNIQPNYIENGTKFIYKLVTKLLIDKTALVLINRTARRNLLYVADSYNANYMILSGKTFSNIRIDDDEGNSINLDKTYNSDNTIYYSIKNSNLKTASENFKFNTAKLLKASQKSFIKANTPKWRLKSPGQQPKMLDAETNKPISYEEYKSKITEGLTSDDEAIVLLSELFDLENLNQKDSKSITDFENVFKKIGDTVAQEWNIPLDVFYGSETEKSSGNNNFITMCVDLYFELLEDGFNASLVGKDDYLKGEYVKFNRLNINHKDLIDKASGWDKLISNGFSFNQLCKFLGLPTINEDWANEHYITKNYANVKGGAESDE